jgi:N6-L-threonylcarbamoyladenine synthase
MTRPIPECVMGFDTSAYTASVALVSRNEVICEKRHVIPVPASRRGLRPSDAVFAHVQNLPELIEEMALSMAQYQIKGICVSAKPRPDPHSYLPPFSVGVGFARSLASAYHVPLMRSTHQEGHIQAALWSIRHEEWEQFSALHISGGTTELLQVRRSGATGFDLKPMAATDDLYAGQLVDRIGVLLGLPFPSGPYLQDLARYSTNPVVLTIPRVWYDGSQWRTSFSGPESQARRLWAQGVERADLARGLELLLVRTMARLVEKANPKWPLVVVGGVAANQTFRSQFSLILQKSQDIYFASPELSRDNAVGIARLGYSALMA